MSDPVLSDYDGDPVSDQSLRRVLRMIAEALRQMDDPQAVASKGLLRVSSRFFLIRYPRLRRTPKSFIF